MKNALLKKPFFKRLKRFLRKYSSSKIIYQRSKNIHSETSIKYDVIKDMIINSMDEMGFSILNNFCDNRIEFFIEDVSVGFTISDGDNFPRLAVNGTKWDLKLYVALTVNNMVYREIITLISICNGGRGAIWSISYKDLFSQLYNIVNGFDIGYRVIPVYRTIL